MPPTSILGVEHNVHTPFRAEICWVSTIVTTTHGTFIPQVIFCGCVRVHSRLGYYVWDEGAKDYVALDLNILLLFIIVELRNFK